MNKETGGIEKEGSMKEDRAECNVGARCRRSNDWTATTTKGGRTIGLNADERDRDSISRVQGCDDPRTSVPDTDR